MFNEGKNEDHDANEPDNAWNINFVQYYRSKQKEYDDQYTDEFSQSSLEFLRDNVVQIIEQGWRYLERYIAQPSNVSETN